MHRFKDVLTLKLFEYREVKIHLDCKFQGILNLQCMNLTCPSYRYSHDITFSRCVEQITFTRMKFLIDNAKINVIYKMNLASFYIEYS